MNKELLAKLLANENITVLQEPVKTASFDVKNRTLRLPQWKDLSEDMLDLFIGHEVGHALYTTQAFWSDELKKIKHFQGYLNVLEDVRIEKLIKRKYPGLRKPFRLGYDELREKDFFEIQGEDLKDRLLIDRINLFYKAGVKSGVKFTKQESEFVRRAEYTDTVEDVIQLAKEIYEFTRKELQDKLDDMKNMDPHDSDFEDADGDEMEIDAQSEPSEGEEEDEDGEEISGETSIGDQTAEDLMESQTEKALRQKLEDLADTSIVSVYYKLPKKIQDDVVFTGYKQVIEDLKSVEVNLWLNRYYYSNLPKHSAEEYKNKFINESKKIVNYLVKEFEMKKSASNYKRTKQSKSGSLDMRKLYQYKLNDDIFKRVNIVPDGKNHGMVMLVDWSASMSKDIVATLQQVVNLAMFCRAIKVPFSVQALSSEYNQKRDEQGYRIHYDIVQELALALPDDVVNPYSELHLFELFNSKMTTAEFNYMVGQLITTEILEKGKKFHLGGTPLNEALVYMTQYLPQFKKQHNVEKLTFITLSDGEGAGLRDNANFSLTSRRYMGENKEWMQKAPHLIDETTKKTYKLELSNTHTRALLDIIRNQTGATIAGFYITKMSDRNLSMAYSTCVASKNPAEFWTYREAIKTKIRNDGYYTMPRSGYDQLFLVPDKNIIVKDGSDIEINGSESAAKIANQMKKVFGSKKRSRLLLNKFIELVA